jgi:hypothetical protein
MRIRFIILLHLIFLINITKLYCADTTRIHYFLSAGALSGRPAKNQLETSFFTEISANFLLTRHFSVVSGLVVNELNGNSLQANSLTVDYSGNWDMDSIWQIVTIRRYIYLGIPVNVQYQLNRLNLAFGADLFHLLATNYLYRKDWADQRNTRYTQFTTKGWTNAASDLNDGIKKWDAGLRLTGTYEISNKWFAEIMYRAGITAINYETYYSKSPEIKNSYFQLGIDYQLGGR